MSELSAVVDLIIREIDASEFDRVWPIFHTVLAHGDTCSYPPDLSLGQAREGVDHPALSMLRSGTR